MAAKPRLKKTSCSTRHSGDAGDKDRLIAELHNKIQLLENELRSRRDNTTYQDITECKRAEEELKNARFRLERSLKFTEALLAAVPTPVFYKDVEGRYLGCNRAFSELMGVTSDQIKGKTVGEIWPGEYAEVYLSKDRELLKNRVPQIYDYKILDKDGAERPVIYVKDVFRDENDQVAGIVGAFIDITDRKHAEEALCESEARFRAIFDSVNDAIFIHDMATGDVVDVNRKMCEMYGYTREEALQVDVGALSSGESLYTLQDALAWMKKAAEGEPQLFEWRARHITGHHFWVEVNMLRAAVGSHDRLLVVVRDITERKRAKEALQVSEARFNEVLDNLTDAFIIIDSKWRYVYVNEIAAKRFAKSKEQLLGQVVWELWPESIGSIQYEQQLKTMEDKIPRTWINRSTTSDIWYEYRVFPWGDGIASFARDITERKRAEEALKDAKAQAELYLDLMSHDINNMHQIALGYLELARDMQADSRQAKFLDTPMEVLQRSARLIKNVRKLQKLRDGLYETEPFDVTKVLADVQREFGAVPNKSIKLNLNGCEHCGYGHCIVRANELINDVFTNLVTNAIKHTGDRADIVIDLDVVEENGNRYCRVVVEDNGPGIPDNYKDNIFNRILNGPDMVKGMGLGLYLVKSLVESYGGRVWVEDRVLGDNTKGARFVVMLPAVEK